MSQGEPVGRQSTVQSADQINQRVDQRVDQVSVVRNLADRLGICLSLLCLIHCVFTPLLIIVLPSLHFLDMFEHFHELLLFVLPVLALLAFVPGYRKHRDRRVFFWALPGLALVAIAATAFDHEDLRGVAFSIVGSVLLIQAHLLNRRLCVCCESDHKH